MGGLAAAEGFGTCVLFLCRSRLGTVAYTVSYADSNSCQVLFITRLFPITGSVVFFLLSFVLFSSVVFAPYSMVSRVASGNTCRLFVLD